jgi:hypothetical protein
MFSCPDKTQLTAPLSAGLFLKVSAGVGQRRMEPRNLLTEMCRDRTHGRRPSYLRGPSAFISSAPQSDHPSAPPRGPARSS